MMRLRDLLIACIVLALTFPLMLMVGLAIKLDTAGPILARHNCIGRGGRRFQMLKFRTSVQSPEHLVPPWAEKITRWVGCSGTLALMLSRSSSMCCAVR